jgi:hypothetical protein
LDEGEDWVFTSDLVQLGKNGFSVTFGLDGAQLGGNDVEGFNDLGGGGFSRFEVFVVLGSGVSEDLLLLVEDVQLGGLVLNLGLEEVEVLGEGLDFVARLGDFVGGELDSSVVSVDFSFAVGEGGGVLEISFLLLEDEVFSQVLEHLGDVSKRGLVLHLQSDGVQQSLSEVSLFDLFELSEDGHVRITSSLLNENSVSEN